MIVVAFASASSEPVLNSVPDLAAPVRVRVSQSPHLQECQLPRHQH